MFAAEVPSPSGHRVLPHNLEAERSVLGGVLLLQRKAFLVVQPHAHPEDFYHPAHAAIFQAMADLDASGTPIDTLTVIDHMKRVETYYRLRAVNGEAYFVELMAAVLTVENIAYHAKMVHGKALRRRMIETAQRVMVDGYAEGEDEEYLAEAEASIHAVASRGHSESIVPLHSLLHPAIATFERRYEKRHEVIGVPTGYVGLDTMTAGFQPSDLIIVAGRPSMGKTALALSMVVNAGLDFQIPSLVFSLEMSNPALVERLIAQRARVNSQRLRTGKMDVRDWTNAHHACAQLADAPIWLDDTAAPSVADIRSKTLRWREDAAQGGRHPEKKAYVVVDYIGLLGSPKDRKKNGNREQEVSENSRALKALAKELRCPVVALCQLNRQVESRSDKRPQLSDLRESGAIEQDADVVIFLYRDEVYNKMSPDMGIAEIIVGKQRNGPLGVTRLAFLDSYARFENLAPGSDVRPAPPTGDHDAD